eukprot:271050_1
MFTLLFTQLLSFLLHVSGDCGYVDWTATVGSIFSVGEFILSEKKCQSLSASLNVFGKVQTIDGAIEFACDPTDSNTLIIHEYSDVLCASKSSPALAIQVGDSIPLFNDALYFHLNEFVCSTSPDCGIDITFSTDCKGMDSTVYSNLGIPPNSCQTFGDDFDNPLLRKIPYEIFPMGVVDGLYSNALEFKCCEEDHSLLIYNYSESNCLESTPFNTLRLSKEYNGQCFALGNTQKPFDITSDKAATEDVNARQDVFALRYSWKCDKFVDCEGISFMETRQIPNVCPEQCLIPGMVWTTPAPTSSPTMHPVSESEESHLATASARNIHEQSSSLSGETRYIVYALLLVFGVIAVAAIGYIMYHRCKLQRTVEQTEQGPITAQDSRFQPMIDSQAIEPALIKVTSAKSEDKSQETAKDSGAGEYVLPSTVTTGGETNNDSNLLV